MKFKLKIEPITANVKQGFYVLFNDSIVRVVRIFKNDGYVALSNGSKMSIKTASENVAKLIAEGSKRSYSIMHDDYKKIIDLLFAKTKVEFNLTDEDGNVVSTETFNSVFEGYMQGHDITFTGVFEEVLTTVKVDEPVQLTNIDLIDKYTDYIPESRIGIVTNYDVKTHDFTIKLHSSGKIITCKRKDFKRVTGVNHRVMIKVPCEVCGK